MRLGLLSGTFDPVHLGHVQLGRAALAAEELDAVVYLVNPDPGHKVSQVGLADRLAMVRLALEGQERLRVYDGAWHQAPHRLETFRHIMHELGAHEYVYVVGIDTLVRLDTWADAQTIVESTTFAVARRPGTETAAITALRWRLGPVGEQLRLRWFAFDDHRVVSSSQIRGLLGRGQFVPGLDERVERYIRDHRLYHGL